MGLLITLVVMFIKHLTKNLRLMGQPSTEYCWFPGYAWTITECLELQWVEVHSYKY